MPKRFRTVKCGLPVPEEFRRKVTARIGDTGPRWATFHKGTDFGVPDGTPVLASVSGKVVHASNDGGKEGLYISVDFKGPYGLMRALYFHLSTVNAEPGDNVKRGQQIGTSGHSGNVTGPHLHFQIQKGMGTEREFFEPIFEKDKK